MRPLTARQIEFAELLANGVSIVDAGRRVGVSRTTAKTWARRDDVRCLADECRAARWRATVDSTAIEAAAAVHVLKEAMAATKPIQFRRGDGGQRSEWWVEDRPDWQARVRAAATLLRVDARAREVERLVKQVDTDRGRGLIFAFLEDLMDGPD